ncbi:hypothetical protein BYT27DRAFT_6930005 [Phlegmacium glaucopus]|nr:hypothetical protein BYT27DRAFT_6930005 [Phlegmacium glaucopus]
MQHSVHDHEISDDDSFGSDFDSAAEEMDADEKDGDQRHLLSSTHPDSSKPTPKPDAPRRSNSLTLPEQSPGISTSPLRSVCVVSS